MHTFYLQTCDGDLIAEVSIAENSLTMAVQQAIDNNIDLSDADFQGKNLDSLLAAGAQLNRANFSQSSLVGADFSGAQLKDTSFAYADLTGAIFSNSSLNLLTDFTGSIMMNTIYETG
ncbi:pentapeptide repeat-containing protein [Spirosoma pollinicola]|uniref:Pentapeptide repeat-containing protein n=1 Tax=Spirosoma pollinicola TaxID=2057025 RepID=A0A2K8Z2C3_9BACT|nr:pentapeptide repeat-containing protein [Spirosoma pollinicola]AUD04023.1 hypothetical protein CWM47_20645 [Spirosoma pollinicola]